MTNYQHINSEYLDKETINKLYKDLLKNKRQFLIIESKDKKYCLTKEKSIFEIESEEDFIKEAVKDIYYKTTINKNIPK